MASVWGELKRRNVVRVAVAYVIVAWLILQLADVLAPMLSLPEWVGKLVFLLLLVGLPLAVFFAWVFELTPEGVKKEKDVDRSRSITHATGRKLDFAIIGVLVVALGFFAVDRFVLNADDSPSRNSASEIGATEVQQSIAVLPFVNMSSDPEQEFFSDGLSEELLNLLARIPELKVIGRTSSFAFKGKNEDLRDIGQALGVNTVLEGSVRKSGERIRITAQLIDASDGAHIWSETYDRTMTDVFEIQDSVAAEILDALKVHVGVMPERGRPTANSAAYTLFLKARAHLNNYQVAEAADLLRNVVEQDPLFADAWELLAYAYWLNAGTVLKSAEGQRLSSDAAGKALAINPDLVLAQSLYQSGNIENYTFLGELEALERATRLEPGKTESFDMLAYDLIEAGYIQEALAVAEQYVKLDPLSPAAHLRLYQALTGVERIDEAEESMEAAIQLGGQFGPYLRAVSFLVQGRDDEAIPQLAAFLEGFGLPASLARDFISGARDPGTGPAFLDQQISKMVAAVPDENQNDLQRLLISFYGHFGYYDRLVELILDADPSGSTWSEADEMMTSGNMFHYRGFTAQPKYLEAAESMGIVALWEQRRPPDFCKKISDQWVCE